MLHMSEPAISVQALRKSYGPLEAIKGVDFEILPGEVFGLLGPNGAGKTSTVEIMEGLRTRSAGEVRVLGFDPEKQKKQLKDRIGVCLQATNLPEKIRLSTPNMRTRTNCLSVCNLKTSATRSTEHFPADKSSGWLSLSRW
jgi:ABC-type Na+ transport system ATPase subunit NatA